MRKFKPFLVSFRRAFFLNQTTFQMTYVYKHTITLLTVFKLGPDSPGKLERSDSKIGRGYKAKLWHFLSV